MLDLHYLAAHADQVLHRLQQRNLNHISQDIAALLHANQQRKETQLAADKATHTLKLLEQQLLEWIQEGDTATLRTIREGLGVQKTEQKILLEQLKDHEKTVHELLLHLPNLPDPRVPVGKGPEDNVCVYQWTPSVMPHAPLLPHWELVERYELIDFQAGSKITGGGFPVYTGQGAKLQRALINFFLDQACAKGYQEVQPPLVVNSASALGTGQLPDKQGMMYELQQEGLYLVPTAEVPVTNLYRDRLLKPTELPVQHVAYTPCFRREAGSWGRHVRGLNRLHQFDKVELVHIEEETNSEAALTKMCDHVGGLLQALGLRYRIMQLCTADLGFAAAITYDFDVWSPGQEQWLEVSSVSSFGSYQARRMKLRYKKNGHNLFCHTLNGSALALPRVVAALLEHYQTPEGIRIPQVLQAYTGFEVIKLC